MITLKDLELRDSYINVTPRSFVGGSYIVNTVAANDIDIVVPLSAFNKYVAETMGFKQEWVEIEDTYRDDEFNRLHSTYRKDNVNLLVINDLYIPAYIGAVRAMKQNPEFFCSREARIALHKELCRTVKAVMNYDLSSLRS